MSLISLIVVLVIIGVALAFIPMEPRIKTIAVVAVGVIVAVLLFNMLGGHLTDIRIGDHR